MNRRHALAYGLIAFGLVALLAQATGTTGWLWLGVLAAASLVAYANTRGYAFLLLGGIFAGSALGVLLTGLFRYDGIFLVSLGAALVAVDRIESRGGRWAAYLGAVLVAIGLIAGLADSGVLRSAWLPVVLIAIGIALLWRDARDERPFPPPMRGVAAAAPPDAAGQGRTASPPAPPEPNTPSAAPEPNTTPAPPEPPHQPNSPATQGRDPQPAPPDRGLPAGASALPEPGATEREAGGDDPQASPASDSEDARG